MASVILLVTLSALITVNQVLLVKAIDRVERKIDDLAARTRSEPKS